jgi:hypothetical protein
MAKPGAQNRAARQDMTNGLCWRRPRWDGRAAAKGIIAEGRLPVSSGDQLSAVEKLSVIEKRPGKVGTIEHRLKEIRSFEMSAGQIGLGELRAPEIGVPQVRQGQIKAAQIETS